MPLSAADRGVSAPNFLHKAQHTGTDNATETIRNDAVTIHHSVFAADIQGFGKP